MHQGPGDRGERTRVAPPVPLQHPAQRATDDLLDVGGGHRDDGVGRAQRRVGRHRGGAVPVVRVGAGNARLREPGELGRGAGAAGGARGAVRPVGSAGGPAQLADQLGQHEGAARPVDGPIGLSGGQRIELVEEAGRLLVLALDRADQQGVPGPGAGDVEQPALFGEQRRDPRDGGAGGLGDPGQQVDEPLIAQQAAAQPQIRPGAFLDAGHGDDVPLAPAGGVRGEQLDGVAARGAVGQRIARELLLGEVFGEGGDVGAGEPVGEAGGGVEEGQHGVEIAVGGSADGPAAGAGVVPAAVEPAGLPHPPEHLLGALARTGGVTRDRQEGPDPAQRGGLVGGQGVERIRPPRRGRPQGLDQQRIAPDPLGLGRSRQGDPISALPAPRRRRPAICRVAGRRRRHATTCLAQAPPPRHHLPSRARCRPRPRRAHRGPRPHQR